MFKPIDSTPQLERSLRANYNPFREVVTKCRHCSDWSYTGTVEEGHASFMAHCAERGHLDYSGLAVILNER